MIITVDFQEDLKHRTKAQIMDEAVDVIEAKLDAAIAELKEQEDAIRKAYDTAVARVVGGFYTMEDIDILIDYAGLRKEEAVQQPKKVATKNKSDLAKPEVISPLELFELLETLRQLD